MSCRGHSQSSVPFTYKELEAVRPALKLLGSPTTVHHGMKAELGVCGGWGAYRAKNGAPYILCFYSYFITYEACGNF